MNQTVGSQFQNSFVKASAEFQIPAIILEKSGNLWLKPEIQLICRCMIFLSFWNFWPDIYFNVTMSKMSVHLMFDDFSIWLFCLL